MQLKRHPDWSFHAGALHGSTHYDLPGPLLWFTRKPRIREVLEAAERVAR